MSGRRIAIILSDLRAEGGPALAADLAAEWRAAGHDPIALLLNDGEMAMADRFAAIDVPVESMAVGHVTPKRYPAIAARARKVFTRLAPHATVSIPNGVHGPLFLGAALAGVRRRVVHVGNYPWHWQSDFWKYKLLMRSAAPVTHDLVCVTRHVAEGVAAHFGHVARRVHVVANGVDLSAFPFRGDPVPVPDTHPIRVLMVARLDGGKDHATLIDAVQILRSRSVNVKLELAGEGSLHAAISEQVQAAGLTDHIALLGVRRDIAALLAAADVFAFSVQPEEGLGIALIEAMAAGVPVVATDVGACREVLDDGAAGALVPPRDPQAFAEAILAAAVAPDRRKVRAARERTETIYSRAAMAASYGALCGL